MTDTTDTTAANTVAVTVDQLVMSNTARKNCIYIILLYCLVLITYLVFNGDDSNTLHTSALSWAFTVAGGIVSFFVAGVSWDNWKASQK